MATIVNPFEIKTPEQNTAQDIVDLFVDVFTDFKQVLEKGHTFLNGPRGSGKSMMFRYIMPDCQKIVTRKSIKDLDYFSIYIPIKLTSINIPDLGRLENYAKIILNEHLFSTYVISNVLSSLIDVFGDELNNHSDDIITFFKNDFVRIVSNTGYKSSEINISEANSGKDTVLRMATIISDMNRECRKYCTLIALSKNCEDVYTGSIADFMDFVYPLLLKLKSLPFFPQEKPFYLLIDDAGYLNTAQTNVLNTWVSYRTTKDICFKISTQLDYKTHITTNGKRIDSPHDYSEINISTVYASSKSLYNERIENIIKKRIHKYLKTSLSKINVREYFPEDEKQKQEIEAIKIKIKEKNFNPEKSYAAGDAAKRYTVPEYMKNLQQKHRSGFNYSYAGFDQLVAISSGIIRHFLAPAQEMFSEAVSLNGNKRPDNISDSIQDKIIKKYSSEFLITEFDKIRKDLETAEGNIIKADKLYNLIDSLGQLFHKILVSNVSERIVFSVALTDKPDDELREILELGEQFGYLHKSTIGNKQGTGRNRLYILSRILSPHFKLYPESFAGYQFMESATLKIALKDKAHFLRAFDKKLNGGSDNLPSLFDNID
jgi:hypothetical protein